MDWQIEKGVRCDFAFYAARNLVGQRHQVRVFPQGNRQGDVPGSAIASMVIRAPYGVRIVFVSAPGIGWEQHPWRCVRFIEGQTLRAEGVALPGIRIPDLDLLDGQGAKKTDNDREVSYPHAERLDAGTGWTFGRIGALKGRVQLIRIEKDRGPGETRLPEPDAVARAVIVRGLGRDRAGADALIDDAVEALRETLTQAGHADADTRADQLAEWARARRDEG